MRNTNILNKKGFTLIELLAVIVILAILMLLATPSVLKIMNNAQKSAFETEAATILSAAKTQYAADAVTTDGSKNCYDKSTLTTKNQTPSVSPKGPLNPRPLNKFFED